MPFNREEMALEEATIVFHHLPKGRQATRKERIDLSKLLLAFSYNEFIHQKRDKPPTAAAPAAG